MGLRRLPEAVSECEEAIKLDPGYVRARHRLGYVRARHRLGSLLIRHKADQDELQKLHFVEKHLSKCIDFRRVCDWRNTLNEADAAISSGAYLSSVVRM